MSDSSLSKSRSRYHIPNVERALKTMELLARHPAGLGASDIARMLGVSRNSAYRVTITLLSHGYLQQDDETKRFVLSRKLLVLGYAAVSEHNLVEKALDVMRELRDVVKETVLIGTLAGAEGIVLEQIPSLYQLKYLVDVGMRFPLHCNAPGKAFLAFLPAGESEKLLRRIKLTRFTDRTITGRKALREELRGIRECGYSVDRGEVVEGCHCVGAPVFDQHNYPIATIWATGPSDRLREEDFDAVGEQVKKHAARISRRLGNGLLEKEE